MSEATKSHYAMFRGAIALAWADHRLDEMRSPLGRMLHYLGTLL